MVVCSVAFFFKLPIYYYQPSIYLVGSYLFTYLPSYNETYFPTYLAIDDTYFPTYLAIDETYFFFTKLVTEVETKY
jgi:hypothetical protein